MQFNAQTLKVVSHIFRKRILMTFDQVRETFLLILNLGYIKLQLFDYLLIVLRITQI